MKYNGKSRNRCTNIQSIDFQHRSQEYNKESGLSTDGVGITDPMGGKITPYPHLTPYEEMNYPRQKMTGLNVKTKTMELQEENIGKYLCDLGTEKVSQHTSLTIEEKTEERYTGHYQDSKDYTFHKSPLKVTRDDKYQEKMRVYKKTLITQTI